MLRSVRIAARHCTDRFNVYPAASKHYTARKHGRKHDDDDDDDVEDDDDDDDDDDCYYDDDDADDRGDHAGVRENEDWEVGVINPNYHHLKVRASMLGIKSVGSASQLHNGNCIPNCSVQPQFFTPSPIP